MTFEQSVVQHYRHGSLETAILEALTAAGKNIDRLAPADLTPVDEFHIGGRLATIDLAAQMEIGAGLYLLDIGCGVGGASRYFAQERGCRVTGIDLADEYVRAAAALARRVGLGNRVSYRQGSALDLPFPPATFDGAYMLHVGMNIADKGRAFAEARRVLKPGGVFAIYDVMRETGEGELSFPVPWAASPETSFVESAPAYRGLLEGTGFAIAKERSRREFAIEFFRQMRAQANETGGPPPLGLHILMGSSAAQKAANIIANLERGLVAPTEIVALAI